MSVVQEEVRSKNIMVFNLPEETSEDLNLVLKEIELKPSLEPSKVCKK